MSNTDCLIIGGGVLGLSLAWGLIRNGASVTVLDSASSLPRASTANFGLVWLQSKGETFPAYAQWSRSAVDTWPAFAANLLSASGIDPRYRSSGGFAYCLGEAEWKARGAKVAAMKAAHTVDPYNTVMVTRQDLFDRMPDIQFGPDVFGASWNPHDGDVDPLRLMQSLQVGLKGAGAVIHHDVAVERITRQGRSFTVHAAGKQWHGEKLILAAGLGNVALAAQLGLHSHVRSDRGQILVTERVSWRLPYPANGLRQTPDGTFLIGATKEGTDTNTQATDPMQAIAMTQRATRILPALRHVRVVRAWAGLRTLSKDSAPVYDQHPDIPGATVVNSHSGITLAPLHASLVADWICDGSNKEELAPFSSRRFDVSPTA